MVAFWAAKAALAKRSTDVAAVPLTLKVVDIGNFATITAALLTACLGTGGAAAEAPIGGDGTLVAATMRASGYVGAAVRLPGAGFRATFHQLDIMADPPSAELHPIYQSSNLVTALFVVNELMQQSVRVTAGPCISS